MAVLTQFSASDAAADVRETLNGNLRQTQAFRLNRLIPSSFNPLDLPPLTVPTTYANSTAYAVGQVIVGTNGNWYVCVIGGTSAATGTGPSATNNVNAGADGTAYFAYYSGPLLTSNDPNAPSVSYTTTTPSSLSTLYSLSASPLPFSTRGITGITSVAGGAGGLPYTFADGTGANVAGGIGFAFETESAGVAISINQGSTPVRVIIDGRYYTAGSLPLVTNAGFTWAVFTFAGRKLRSFVVESGFQGNATSASFGTTNGTVRVDANAQIRPLGSALKMVAISDSLFRGSDQGPMIPANQVPLQVGKRLGIADVYNLSIGGTGWLARGTSGSTAGTQSTFRERIAQGLALNPDFWLIGGSVNDISLPSASITAEVTATIQALRAGGSTAPIVIFGVLAANYSGATTVEAAVLAGVSAATDPYSFWVPCATDPLGAWVNAANTAMMATSGPHSTDFTLNYWASRLTSAIRQKVNV